MKNLYQAFYRKAGLLILFAALFSSTLSAQIRTYDTTFNGWNAIVTEDMSLSGTDSAAGIIFFPGLGEQSTDSSVVALNGPHAVIRSGAWDGSVTLGNGVHHPFIISLQPSHPFQGPAAVKPEIDAILSRYRIKRSCLYFTGLSQGGWQANLFVTYEPTPGDDSYGRMVKAVVVLEGVEPADNTGLYASLPYPQKMGHWAAACGGRELWMEGSQDWRDMQSGAQNMMDSVAGSASYFQVTYGGGGHCCWNSEYNPNAIWTSANTNISQIVGAPQNMNLFQWLLRQGDTSMPGHVSPPVPTVGAGSAQTIQLPVSTATLTGTASGNGGATISSTVWTEVSGPATASFGAAGSLSTGISGLTVAGTYVFQLQATDNNSLSATATVNVIVKAANVAPSVGAGSTQTIQLPVNTATLTGTASGNGGATISSTAWTEVSGPATASFGAAGNLSTGVSGLTVPGTYVFQLKATDNNSLSATATVNVIVKAANVAPSVGAGSAQAIQLPVSTVTLTGTASGNGGATISSTAWTEVSGPATASFGAAGNLSTGVSGLTVAGVYTFKLTATDNNSMSATGTVSVTVNAINTQPPSAGAGSAQSIQLPVSSVTLTGTASGNAGATISSTAWSQTGGPATAVIAAAGSLSTGLSGLTVAGTYTFELTATDNNGLTATASVNVIVKAANVAPSVGAGSAQSIQLPVSSVTLTGTASGNAGATISSTVWTELSGPVTATIAGAGGLSTGVSGLTVVGTYIFQLKVTDNNGLSSTATVTITVTRAANLPPVANAGPAQTVQLPVSSVLLDGSGSHDPDGTIVDYRWTDISGGGGVSIVAVGTAQATVYGLSAGTTVIQLTVTDNDGATGTSTVTITTKAAVSTGSLAPVANAGRDTSITLPFNTVTLDGSASTDPSGRVLQYKWVQLSGPATAGMYFSDRAMTPVGSLQAGLYIFQLTVTNAAGLSSTATVQVRVVDNNRSAGTGSHGSAQTSVYPNPVQGILNIQFTDDSTSGPVLMQVYSLEGRLVRSRQVTLSQGYLETTIDMTGLAKGVYALRIAVGNSVRYQKIVKQ
ncbi:MAG TPA: PKD domain-containing protein [Puia sp.]|jgi:hypothetical protein